MHWNVYREDFNARKIEVFDIFRHHRFKNAVEKLLKTQTNKASFADDLKHELMYNFWCKCEYEVVITSWPPYINTEDLQKLNAECKEKEEKYGHPPYKLSIDLPCAKKVDVYSQVMLNWDAFLDYVWSFRK